MVNALFAIISFSLTFVGISFAEFNSLRKERNIVERVLKDYNPIVRPSEDALLPILLQVDLIIRSLIEINEAQETLLFAQWMQFRWKDPYFKWNATENGGLEVIEVPVASIWHPDVVIYGMISIEDALPLEKNYAKISNDGAVYASLLQNVRVHCTFHVALFPFDRQNCSLHLGSWMYTQNFGCIGELDIYPYKSSGNMEDFERHAAWELISFNTSRRVYSHASGNYSDIFFFLELKRKPLYYLLTIVGLFSPFNNVGERQEKVTLGLTTLLTMAIMLLMVQEQMPKSSDGLPLMGLFIMFELMTASLAILTAVGIMYLHRSGTSRPPSSRLLSILCLGPEKTKFYPSGCNRNKESLEKDMNRVIENYSDVPSLPATSYQRPQHSATKEIHPPNMKYCFENIWIIRKRLDEMKEDAENAELWAKLCSRLDGICLIFSLLLNIIVSVLLMLVYPSLVVQ